MEVLVDYAYREDDLARLPIEELARFVMAAEGKPDGAEVSIAFVDDGAMAELNACWRGRSGPTDVLSFECDSVGDAVTLTSAPDAPYELGDVIIAPDVAEAQAPGFGNGFQQEIELLLVHGLLHLCGYDHLQDDEAEVMEARERELLDAFRSRPEGR